jgi:molybdopterin converting factor small subunit
MSFVFLIPGALRQFTDGQGEVSIHGNASSVADAFALLCSRHPGVRDRVLTERGDVRTHVNIFVDGENIRDAGGLAAPVRDRAEIVIVPAVSGG